ncbi:(p)ppGpp synthase/hydrolase [Bacillus phage vB_BanS-Thrax1]|nr:(p)ppGpp synthase/hydrolase [Bacillus phage vB_BanS-Thrax1]
MAKESRVVQLQMDLAEMGYKDALKALNWMISVMNADNGYKRHDGRHYYYHLVDATQELINMGVTDEVVLTACILHDAIEDVDDINYEGVKSLFGKEVADTVLGVTKNPDVNYKKGENLKAYLDAMLPHVRMCLVKTADRMHNFSTLKDATPEKELRQAIETETYFLPFFKECRKRYPEYARFFHSAKTTIMPHLIKIKQHHAFVAEHERQIAEIKRYLYDELQERFLTDGRVTNQAEVKLIEEIARNIKHITKGGTLK